MTSGKGEVPEVYFKGTGASWYKCKLNCINHRPKSETLWVIDFEILHECFSATNFFMKVKTNETVFSN